MKDPLHKRGDNGKPRFGGDLSAFSLFEMCQFLMVVRRTGTLTVKSGKRTATLGIDDGQIVSVLDHELQSGEEAFYRIACWADGQFDFTPGPVSGSRLGLSTDGLLLEAARRLDEGEMIAETQEEGGANRVQSLLAGQHHMEEFAALRQSLAGGAGGDVDFRKEVTLEAVVSAARHLRADAVHLRAELPARARIEGRLGDLGGGAVPRRALEKLILALWPEGRPPDPFATCERRLDTGDSVRAAVTAGPAGDSLRLELLGASAPAASDFGEEGAEFLAALVMTHTGIFAIASPHARARATFLARLALDLAESGLHVLWMSETGTHSLRPQQGWIETFDLTSATRKTLRQRLLDDHPDAILVDPVRHAEWARLAARAAERGAMVVFGLETGDLDAAEAKLLRLLHPRDRGELEALAASARGVVLVSATGDAALPWNATLGALTEAAVLEHFESDPQLKAA